jgi:hypothetical protein
MHLLNGGYTGYFNVRRRRAGHLFQGRFKAHLIEEEPSDTVGTVASGPP